MTSPLFSPLVERAMRRAARAHRNHRRKASDLPYISHPAGVALILLQAGFDDEAMLAAALLHDVVEDTECDLADLEAEFPPVVVEYVDALTEDKHDADGRKRSWQSRKEDHLREVAEASPEARTIVLADKLHNLGCMVYDLDSGEELWSRFGAAPDRVLWYHREMIAIAAGNDDQLQDLAANCRNLLKTLEADAETKRPDQ